MSEQNLPFLALETEIHNPEPTLDGGSMDRHNGTGNGFVQNLAVQAQKPPLDVDALMERIKAEVAHHQRSNRRFLGGNRINTTPLGIALSRMEMLLNTAETRAYQRTKWPGKLDRFPFSLSHHLKNTFLKLFNVVFKDQQEVNFSVIAALRESISLNRQLLSQLESLQLQMRSEMEIMLTALDAFEHKEPEESPVIRTGAERQVRPMQALAHRQAEKERGQQLDEFYMALEDRFRGEKSLIYDRLCVYLPFVQPNGMVLDLGCGRGEWLEVLRDRHIAAVGVDANPRMVKKCEDRKINVIQADILAHLGTLANDSVGTVTGFHIIEHLPFDMLIEVFSETLRVLRPGGIAIFETPNPENVTVGSCNFYIDPTHQKPLPSSVVQFLAQEVGFVNTQVQYHHPNPGEINNQVVAEGPTKEIIDRFNHFFYGAQDYAILGYKQK